VISRSGVVISITNCYIRFTFLLTLHHGCSLILPRPRCSSVPPLDVSISSRLVLLVLVTRLCFRYEQFETWGSTLTQRAPYECSRHCNRQSVFCCTPSNTQCASFADTYHLVDTIDHVPVVTKLDYCSSVLWGIF